MDGSRHLRFDGYTRAADLADRLREEVDGWSTFDLWTVGVQLVRAADSVGANIAEAFGRGAGADRRRLFLIARGSLTELEHWIARAVHRGLLPEGEYEPAIADVGRPLSGLIRTEVR